MSKYTPTPLKNNASPLYASLHIAYVVAERNKNYTQKLVDKSNELFAAQWCSSPDVFWVPGSLELLWFAEQILSSGKYDIVIAFGVIIKGKTMHYEFISQAIFNAYVQLSMRYPMKTLIAGVLTVEDEILLPERISDNYARAALNLWIEQQRYQNLQ